MAGRIKTSHVFPIEEIKEDIFKNDSAIFANTGVMPRTSAIPIIIKKRKDGELPYRIVWGRELTSVRLGVNRL